MDLHVIGGFLGSGKTTAIINALKITTAHGMRAGVITNDKGRIWWTQRSSVHQTQLHHFYVTSRSARWMLPMEPSDDFLKCIMQLQSRDPLDHPVR